MIKFLQLDPDRRKVILDQVSNLTGLPAAAIEKDWWVTLALKVIFELPYSNSMIFKGGTSLSKGWTLIKRFSEDIDIAIDKELLGFTGELDKKAVKALRKKSCSFISTDFYNEIDAGLKKLEISKYNDYSLNVVAFKDSDTDPLGIELHYEPVTDKVEHLQSKVIIEAGVRSMIEPYIRRPIQSFIGEFLPGFIFSDSAMLLPIAFPKKTFLEKAFLLHEEFQRPSGKIDLFRKSRHLYDLEKIMDTMHGQIALKDISLYLSLVCHREVYFHLSGVNYLSHFPDEINFVPPIELRSELERDYNTMRGYMIPPDSLPFDKLIERIEELNLRFRNIEPQY